MNTIHNENNTMDPVEMNTATDSAQNIENEDARSTESVYNHQQQNASSQRPVDLSELTQLQAIYQKLMAGFHISELNLPLWQELDKNEPQYQQLFKALGYNLIRDSRGFFYFSSADSTVTMTKNARRMALLTYTLIDHWANMGYDPLAALFDRPIDRQLAIELYQQHAAIFEQIDIASGSDILNEIIKRMVRMGFAREQGSEYRLLSPCYRFIDAVTELNHHLTKDLNLTNDQEMSDTLTEGLSGESN
jgi:hypothetical protein